MLKVLDRKKYVLKIRLHADISERESAKLLLAFKSKILSMSDSALTSEPEINVILEMDSFLLCTLT